MSNLPIDLRVDHLAIAVKDINTALGFFRRALPIEVETEKGLGSTGDFNWCRFSIGQFKIALIEAAHADSFVRRFIEKRGEGMHHVSLKTTQLEPLIERLATDGLRIVGQHTTKDGRLTASISPRSAHGVLFQIWQAPQETEPEGPHLIPFRLRSGEVIHLYVDHISLAVRNLETALGFFRRCFSIGVAGEPHQGYDGTFVFTSFLLNNCKIEVIAQGEHGPPGFVTRFLERRGEGLHHLSIDVDRLDPLLEQLEADGMRIVDRTNISDNWKTAFISPRSAHGVLIQFWQTPYFAGA